MAYAGRIELACGACTGANHCVAGQCGWQHLRGLPAVPGLQFDGCATRAGIGCGASVTCNGGCCDLVAGQCAGRAPEAQPAARAPAPRARAAWGRLQAVYAKPTASAGAAPRETAFKARPATRSPANARPVVPDPWCAKALVATAPRARCRTPRAAAASRRRRAKARVSGSAPRSRQIAARFARRGGPDACDGATSESCNDAGQWVDGSVSAGTCGAVCTPGASPAQCIGTTPQTCGDNGQWQNGGTCPYVCSGGACAGECVPGTHDAIQQRPPTQQTSRSAILRALGSFRYNAAIARTFPQFTPPVLLVRVVNLPARWSPRRRRDRFRSMRRWGVLSVVIVDWRVATFAQPALSDLTSQC